MERFIGRYAPHAYALLRIMAGLLFAMHGTQKLFGWPPSGQGGGGVGELPPLMVVAGVIELVGGLFIAAGFLTRIAAFLASGQMAVAYFMKHATQNFWPTMNQGELAALFCFVFLFIAAHGPGIWSVEAARGRGGAGFLSRYEHLIYAILRFFAGLMFALHGVQKIFGWPADRPPATSALSLTAGWIEMVCGVLIAFGLLAGWAAFLASGLMAVAYWKSHGLSGSFWPILNKGELATLYCFLWLYVATRGTRRDPIGDALPVAEPEPVEPELAATSSDDAAPA